MLNKEQLDREIANSEKAIEMHKEGIDIHKLVLASFKKELVKLEKMAALPSQQGKTKLD